MAEQKSRRSLKETMQPQRGAAPATPIRPVIRQAPVSVQPVAPQRIIDRPISQQARLQSSQFQSKIPLNDERPLIAKKYIYTPRLIAALCFSGLILVALIAMSFRGSSTVVSVQPVSAPVANGTQAQAVPTKEQNADQVARLARIMSGLGKHILLPNEVPQMMQITNPDELMKQDKFFAGSQKNDVLVIFQKSGKALIYSETRDIIVNVGPVQLDQNAAAGTSSVQNAETSTTDTALKAAPKR